MIEFYLDKNVLFHWLRKNFFSESVPLSSLVIIDGVHKGKFLPTISNNTLFSITNYGIYKLKRENEFAGIEMPESEVESKILAEVESLFGGKWNLVGLTLSEFKTLSRLDMPFEDAYQYKCAIKNKNRLLLTHNVRDFAVKEMVEDITVQKPGDFMHKMLKKKVLSRSDLDKFR